MVLKKYQNKHPCICIRTPLSQVTVAELYYKTNFIHWYIVMRIHHSVFHLWTEVLSGLFQLCGGAGRLLKWWLMQAYGRNIAVLSPGTRSDYLMEVCPMCSVNADIEKKWVKGFGGSLNQSVQGISHLHSPLSKNIQTLKVKTGKSEWCACTFNETWNIYQSTSLMKRH